LAEYAHTLRPWPTNYKNGYIFKGLFKKRENEEEEYATEAICGPQGLLKKFANPCFMCSVLHHIFLGLSSGDSIVS